MVDNKTINNTNLQTKSNNYSTDKKTPEADLWPTIHSVKGSQFQHF